ncbi:MAG: YHS domain-containing (seleno)protein [Pseudomonadota bacterium]
MSAKHTLHAFLIGSTLAVAGTTITAAPAAAADPVYTSFFSNVAVSGYDPVAYFTQSAPVKGSKKYQTDWNGTTWRFVSQDSLDAFVADPEAYAPQYGGYCAWAVSQGYTASADPKQWAIEDGKLYLNYNAEVSADWNADRQGFIAKANANWPSVLDQ